MRLDQLHVVLEGEQIVYASQRIHYLVFDCMVLQWRLAESYKSLLAIKFICLPTSDVTLFSRTMFGL